MVSLGRAVKQIHGERESLQQQLKRLDQAIAALESVNGLGGRGRRRGRRHLSAAARRQIAAAQKARWAKWKAQRRRRAA